MVELRSVGYEAGGTRILDDVSATFREGSFNVLLGPNGAGKSTLLKVATGSLDPSAGEVFYDGRPVSTLKAGTLARMRAVLSQHIELAFPLPVREVALMGRYPHYRSAPATRDLEIVDRALTLVGMDHRKEQAYPTLSGGERQKVQLARVLAQIWNYDDAREHRYLFLDEPTTSLDIHFQIHLLDVAKDLVRHNCTVVAVLHDLNTALRYGDRFFLLDGGRLVWEGDPAALPGEIVEQVFRVRAHAVTDPADGRTFWRFDLGD